MLFYHQKNMSMSPKSSLDNLGDMDNYRIEDGGGGGGWYDLKVANFIIVVILLWQCQDLIRFL